ncbi:MAG: restriction endonuclease, partial [Halioglobus sp.]|nr:restriction endonuclease [Halioglobus sp.]
NDIPVSTLRRELSRKPEIAYNLHPTKFEKLVGSILKDHFDCEVKHIGRSHDGGIDLILIRSNTDIVIQVKRRKSAIATEGVAVIRDLIGAMAIKDKRQGIFVTTANKFSREAQKAVAAVVNNKKVDKIELIDYSKLINILQLVRNKTERPWEKLIDLS